MKNRKQGIPQPRPSDGPEIPSPPLPQDGLDTNGWPRSHIVLPTLMSDRDFDQRLIDIAQRLRTEPVRTRRKPSEVDRCLYVLFRTGHGAYEEHWIDVEFLHACLDGTARYFWTTGAMFGADRSDLVAAYVITEDIGVREDVPGENDERRIILLGRTLDGRYNCARMTIEILGRGRRVELTQPLLSLCEPGESGELYVGTLEHFFAGYTAALIGVPVARA